MVWRKMRAYQDISPMHIVVSVTDPVRLLRIFFLSNTFKCIDKTDIMRYKWKEKKTTELDLMINDTLRNTISMAQWKAALSPLLKHWSYCSLALSHRNHDVLIKKHFPWRPSFYLYDRNPYIWWYIYIARSPECVYCFLYLEINQLFNIPKAFDVVNAPIMSNALGISNNYRVQHPTKLLPNAQMLQ